MGKKRTTKLLGPRAKSKRVKKDRADALTNLPPEMIDLILSYSIQFPDSDHYEYSVQSHTLHAFMAPIAQTSRTLRQRSFHLIWANCFWINFKINSSKAAEMFVAETEFIPRVPTILCSQLPPSMSFLELEVGARKDKPQFDRRTRAFDDATRTFILPYSFDSCNRICSYVADLALSWQLGSVVIRYKPYNKVSNDILTTYIIPSIATIRNLDRVEFDVPEESKPSNFTIAKMVDETARASDLLRAAENVIEIANKYESKGRTDEAGLKFLYSYWILIEAEMFLPHPSDWRHGEREDDPDIDEVALGLAPPARCVIGNKLRQSIHEIEYRACLALQRFCEIHGLAWIASHEKLLGIDSCRWIAEPSFTWFGLSASELAQVHHARVVVARLQDEWEDSIYKDFEWEADDDCVDLEEIYLAHWLDNENHAISELLAELKSSPSEQGERNFEKRMQLRRYAHTAWRGDSFMLREWGGPDILQYLPLARKGLETIIVS